MTKTLCMTVHNRAPKVIDAVFAGLSLPGNRPDEIAVCFDRPKDWQITSRVRHHCEEAGIRLKSITLNDAFEGPRCPSRAWNAALELVTGSHAFCISSEMILGPHSVDMAYHIANASPQDIICGRAEHSGPSYQWDFKDPDTGKALLSTRTMTSSFSPRPLGFCWLLPMEHIRNIGGYDEAYMDGFCYEDDDFVLKMWNDGANIIFCDDVFGMHLEHKRDFLQDQARVRLNEDIFRNRYGSTNYLKDEMFRKVDLFSPEIPGLQIWVHIAPEVDYEKTFKHLAKVRGDYGKGSSWRAIEPKG